MLKLPITLLCFILCVLTAAAEYNMSWSIALDKYSAISHCTRDQVTSWKCKLCQNTQQLKNLTYITNQKTEVVAFTGYMASANKIIVEWRGTTNIRNWIQDFSYYLIEYPRCQQCKIHFGFLTAYLSVQGQLFEAINNLLDLYLDATIISTGSSLGGALATVCGIQLQMKFNQVSQIHVMGSPRVGNANLAQYIKNRIPTTYRVIHNLDIVPHVPLIEQGYEHFPTQIWYDQGMQKYQICDSQSGQDPKCSNQFYPNYSIPDHVSYWYKPDMQDLCTI